MAPEPIEKKLRINPTSLRAYSTGLLQGTAYNRMHAQLTRTLEPFKVSIPEWKLLGQLHEHRALRLATLAEYLSYDPPMVTKLVKRLEKLGFLTRTPDKKDERAKVVTITVRGHTLIEKIEPHIKKSMATMLQGITREELLAYIKTLSVIVNNTQ
jgi:DNA-binding MarR family transcriptional regulator